MSCPGESEVAPKQAVTDLLLEDAALLSVVQIAQLHFAATRQFHASMQRCSLLEHPSQRSSGDNSFFFFFHLFLLVGG